MCKDVDSWIPMGGRISTGRVRRQNLYLALLMENPKGFRDVFATASTSHSNKESDADSPISHVTFVFETKCSGECRFCLVEVSSLLVTRIKNSRCFFQQAAGEPLMIVAEWNGTAKNLSYTYPVTRPDPVTYGWVFIPSEGPLNEASIYSVRVENVIGGGASECRPCPIVAGPSARSGCVSCPPGHYMTPDSRQCVQCMNDTYLNVTKRVGVEACVNCGLNLRSMSGVECGVGDCQLNISDRTYDLSPLKGFFQTRGVSIFGREGSRYVHTYNVSVCSASGRAEKATCATTIKDIQQVSLFVKYFAFF